MRVPREIVLAEGHVGGRGFGFAHYCELVNHCHRLWIEHTVGINRSVYAFCDIEEVRPLGEVGVVEVQFICLCQWVEIGRVEFEDIHCVKGAQGSHPSALSLQKRKNGHPVLISHQN